MNGTKSSGPVKMPVALIDVLAAHHLKEAILIALIKKLKTGEGSKVSVSLYDSAIASLANQASNWLMTGENPEPIGSLHPNIAPYGEMFTTSDNKTIVLAIGNNKQFELLCNTLNCVSLIKDPKFINNTQRVKNRNELYELLQPFFLQEEASILMAKFIKYDVPAGLIKSVKEVFENPLAETLINKETIEGELTRRVKTVIFKEQTT
jgi:crotonobetainyl-CoA:carnitine CoA-transferase CaiB-like acyl-CoA transferase